ncbi:DUF1549 domain-containing protein, partial [bacterium]|nr:DUF1549 domain-containing protein [bacterium]
MSRLLLASHLLVFGALFSGSFLFAVEITPERMEKEAANLDLLISSVLEKSGKTKPAPVDDFTFLRRASLVAIGRIPTLAEIKEFANDPAANKRNRLVDRLYRSKGH